MSNYFEANNSIYASDFFQAKFENCILDGGLEDEIAIDFYQDASLSYNYEMKSSLLKLKNTLKTLALMPALSMKTQNLLM